MVIERQEEGVAAAIHTLEESALAEAHHALTGSGEVLYEKFLRLGSIHSLLFADVVNKAVAREFQRLHQIYHFIRVEAAILVTWFCRKLNRLWDTVREIRL